MDRAQLRQDLQKEVEERLKYALRVLARGDTRASAAWAAMQLMSDGTWKSLTSHVATYVEDFTADAWKEELKGLKDPESKDGELAELVLTPEGLDALVAILHTTSQGRDQVIDQALKFLWKAMQSVYGDDGVVAEDEVSALEPARGTAR